MMLQTSYFNLTNFGPWHSQHHLRASTQRTDAYTSVLLLLSTTLSYTMVVAYLWGFDMCRTETIVADRQSCTRTLCLSTPPQYYVQLTVSTKWSNQHIIPPPLPLSSYRSRRNLTAFTSVRNSNSAMHLFW